MIASLTGRVTQQRVDGIVVTVGGVGLFVVCSPATSATARVGEEITLATSLVVREDSLTLFGFESADSRDLFEVVQAVNGFGPKLAFTLLAFHAPDELRGAIARGDVARLTTTPGVGAKGAQRLILELKDRVGAAGASGSDREDGWESQVTAALVGLGWTASQAAHAVDEVSRTSAGDEPVADLLRSALRALGQS